MTLAVNSIEDLLNAVEAAEFGFDRDDDDAASLADYEPILLMMVDSAGRLLDADDLSGRMSSGDIEQLAGDFAREISQDETASFDASTPRGVRRAVGVRIADSHGWKILGCILRESAVTTELPTQMAASIVCGAFARAAIRRKRDSTILRTRVRHLQTEIDALQTSRGSAVAQGIEEGDLRRQQEEKNAVLEELIQAAEAANQAKSQFLANASHELRTPLTAILGFTDLLADPKLPSQLRTDHVQTIRQNGQVLLALINDILDLSKIEAGKLVVDRRVCSVFDVVNDVVALMRVRAAEARLDMTVHHEFPVPETVQTDPVRFRQILMNLLGNAIKFTEHGSIILSVRLAQEERGPMLQVSVSDTGIGISDRLAPRLFEPFTQEDTSSARQFGGTGLGLAISRRLAKILGGDITVISKLGEGSVFTVSIDPGPLQGVKMLQEPPVAVAKSEPTEPARRRSMSGRVLLAEDGKDNQRLIGFILEKEGLEVDMAEDGQIACQLATESLAAGDPYPLILMDMQMPRMDGYQATRELRRSNWSGKIIALTANAMSGDREKCLQAGCDDYLTKPIDRSVFLATLERCFDESGNATNDTPVD